MPCALTGSLTRVFNDVAIFLEKFNKGWFFLVFDGAAVGFASFRVMAEELSIVQGALK